MVVVLPQPLEPRKPKISPRSMRKLTWSTAMKSPKRMVRSLGLDRDLAVAAGSRGGIADRLVARALLLRQQGDEGLFQRAGAGAARSSSPGAPVASTRPASIATSQSKRAASSM